MMSKEKRRVPKLRFPGFTEDWEQRKLNDLVTIRRGLTYKPSDIAENGIRVLRSSNIDEDQFITSNDDVFVNIEAVNIPFAKNGDILITSANGSNRLVGKHTIIRDIADNSAVHGGFMLLAESNNPLFTDALLSSNWYKRFINTYVAGGNGAIGNLSKSDLESQIVMVPSEHEQAKIGQWYDNINQLITLHQRKLDNLKLKKKALLQKLFPKNGERYPELRFPEFTDAWEQCKLDELTISIGDGLHGTPKYDENGSYYFINGNNLVDSKVSVTAETKKVAFEALSNDDRRLDSTSILMSINGTIGTLARYNNENIMLGKSVAYITPKNINRDFLFYQLQGNVIQSYFYKNLTGTTIKNLGLGTIKNAIVMSTLSEEESKIGQFFYKLDQFITVHQRKLDHLQLQKKALLQQMFV